MTLKTSPTPANNKAKVSTGTLWLPLGGESCLWCAMIDVTGNKGYKYSNLFTLIALMYPTLKNKFSYRILYYSTILYPGVHQLLGEKVPEEPIS